MSAEEAHSYTPFNRAKDVAGYLSIFRRVCARETLHGATIRKTHYAMNVKES